MELTNTYQYIGRSNGVKAYGGSYYYYILLYAKTSGSISTGKHTVSVKMRMACTANSTFYSYYTTANAKADGKNVFSWSSQQIPGSAWGSGSVTEGGATYQRYTDLKEGSVEIDTQYESKSITISASWIRDSISGSVPNYLPKNETATASITVTLPAIPVQSLINSASDVTLGESCAVKWTPNTASLRYKLTFSCGNWEHTTGVIHPNRTTEYTYTGYTIPLEVAKQFKTKRELMSVGLYTYSDSNATTVVGTDFRMFEVTVPDNKDTQPTVSMSLSPVSTLPAPYNSLYIQGHSRVKATLSFGTKYDATVADSNITVCGTVYPSPYESAVMAQTGTISVKGLVKDSRGHYGTIYRDIEVIPYSNPYVRSKSGESEIIAARCDSSANFTDSGTYLKIKAKAVWSKVISNGVQYNYAKIKFRYRKEGGSYSAWQTILDSKTQNSDEVITAPLLNGALDVKTNYQVQIIASDDLYDSVPVTIAVPGDSVYMDRPAGGKSMGLGGYSTGAGIFDVYWRTKARGGLSVFDAKGDEIPLDSTMPIARGQVAAGWNPDTLENGTYVVTSAKALKDSNGNVIMYNGVLIQMNGTVDGSVKIQLALTSDENKNPYYRAYWYGNWGNWRTLKL
jgi:hypothetical protein